ncbi:armadillo-type fold protein [Purpureocillium lilacinum]|uniref:Armadillo-type fold protein n=1 Tax=Purpureocillium lilacinum TaxID=33203 RepID=A0A179HEW2_PURLI|nr:armadillo-type fold protein [Purpureocillium lilacinum]OAQ88168.1 armadillo-type fold protein [Purpureocillium lilacinum]
MQDEQPVRLSLDQVETLILSLYQANPPEVISKAQATLAWFQGSPQAWPMIHQLLERPDDKVKFFGALTVIIKLNKESSSLSDGDATELLVRLVEWYSHSLARGRSGSLVSRKLSSAIATFFLHFHRLWPAYIRHLLVCLAARQSLDPSSVDETVGTADILARLDSAQLQAVTWVVTSVMEDAARFDMNAANNAGLYDAVMENTTDAVALMAVCLSPHLGDPAAHGDAVKCLQSWATFAQRASPGHGNIAASLRPLFEAVISSLSNTSLFDASAELIVDVLSNYPSLMTNTQYEYLATLFTAPWAQERYEKLLQGDFDFDSVQFGHLLLGFGEAKAEALIQGSDGNGQHLLSLLCGLLTAVGYPVAEDRIFVPAVEFWSTFAETMADYIHLDGHETSSPWAASAMAQLLEAVSRAWQKITYPPSEEYSQWDSVDRIGFNDARKDVIDFLQSAYTLAGPQLVATFADLTLSALSRSAWLPLEAAAFCLGGLADCGRDDVRFDAALTPVFASPLFSVLRDNSQGGVHPRSRQTCLSLIEQYNEYFERNVEFLAPALRLLFTLLKPENDPELSQNGIEFASRLLSKSPVTVLSLQPSDATEFLFLFTLRVLDGKEPLPKGAAADFWSTYVSLTGNEELQQAIKGSMVTLGPLLAQSLARNFGGNASRSELDKLSEPLKKLVSRHAGAKDWLQTALNDGSFPSSKVSAEQKSAFVKKVISLRGARATNQVVRDFWLSARGSNFAYVS